MKNIQKEYNAITSRIAVGIAKEQEKLKKLESTSKSKESCNLRLEKLKMPTFDGDIRQYPRFKKDFEQQVLPGLPKESAPYALRSCLGREPLSIVRSVEDDIEEMLKRLDEKYGDPAKIAEVVIASINEVKVIKEGEHKRFINFVNIVEDAYQDLRRLGLEKDITTTSSVSIIEKKLPNDVRKEWTKLVSFDTSEVDKRDKFPSLMKFLLNPICTGHAHNERTPINIYPSFLKKLSHLPVLSRFLIFFFCRHDCENFFLKIRSYSDVCRHLSNKVSGRKWENLGWTVFFG